MFSNSLNWVQLLHRVGQNSHRLERLEQRVSAGSISVEGFYDELIFSGFTISEAQELYTILR